MFVQWRQQAREKDPETGPGVCQSRWGSRGDLWRGTGRGGAFPSPLPCHEVLCLFPPCWIPQFPHLTKELGWAGPLWLQASVSPSAKRAEWDWSLLLLGSPSANSCLDARLIMDGASLSGFSISLFSAKLSQTAALLRDRLADESRIISGF